MFRPRRRGAPLTPPPARDRGPRQPGRRDEAREGTGLPAIEYKRFTELVDAESADALLRLCERFGRYGHYSEETSAQQFGEGLFQRHDAVMNFLATGGISGQPGDARALATRTNYFREEYAYGEKCFPGIESFRGHPGFAEGARELFARPIVEPAIVFANLMLPGQELALHTDVPEFRGMDRRSDPQWLLVAMHHSGLFRIWRKHIATAIAWFGSVRGGSLLFYPDGPWGPPVQYPVLHNSALLFDADSIFHGVEPVGTGDDTPLPDPAPDQRLEWKGSEGWVLLDNEKVLARYRWQQVRFSISWKAYCYEDEAEREKVRMHSDDINRDQAIEMLVEDLRRRRRIEARPSDTELALTIIREYIRFPPPLEAPRGR